MGRLLGVPTFLTQSSWNEEKEDASAIRKAKKADDDGQSLRMVQIPAVRRMQKQFTGHILRRTTDSRNWRDQTLLNLPPHKTIMGVLRLTSRETNIISERAEEAKARFVIMCSFSPSYSLASPQRIICKRTRQISD